MSAAGALELDGHSEADAEALEQDRSCGAPSPPPPSEMTLASDADLGARVPVIVGAGARPRAWWQGVQSQSFGSVVFAKEKEGAAERGGLVRLRSSPAGAGDAAPPPESSGSAEEPAKGSTQVPPSHGEEGDADEGARRGAETGEGEGEGGGDWGALDGQVGDDARDDRKREEARRAGGGAPAAPGAAVGLSEAALAEFLAAARAARRGATGGGAGEGEGAAGGGEEALNSCDSEDGLNGGSARRGSEGGAGDAAAAEDARAAGEEVEKRWCLEAAPGSAPAEVLAGLSQLLAAAHCAHGRCLAARCLAQTWAQDTAGDFRARAAKAPALLDALGHALAAACQGAAARDRAAADKGAEARGAGAGPAAQADAAAALHASYGLVCLARGGGVACGALARPAVLASLCRAATLPGAARINEAAAMALGLLAQHPACAPALRAARVPKVAGAVCAQYLRQSRALPRSAGRALVLALRVLVSAAAACLLCAERAAEAAPALEPQALAYLVSTLRSSLLREGLVSAPPAAPPAPDAPDAHAAPDAPELAAAPPRGRAVVLLRALRALARLEPQHPLLLSERLLAAVLPALEGRGAAPPAEVGATTREAAELLLDVAAAAAGAAAEGDASPERRGGRGGGWR